MLVTSQDPDLNASCGQVCNALWHAILQLVFNGGGTQQDHVLLNLFIHSLQFVITVLQGCGCFVMPLAPVSIVLGVNHFFRQAEGSQAILGKVLEWNLGVSTQVRPLYEEPKLLKEKLLLDSPGPDSSIKVCKVQLKSKLQELNSH